MFVIIAICYGICMGANIINLLGMDCNYIEFIPECEKQPNGTLKIIKQPINNPNYYYPAYQRVGDLYNVPNTDRIHKKSWKDLNNLSKRINNNVVIKNYNTSDKLDDIFNRFNLKDLKYIKKKTYGFIDVGASHGLNELPEPWLKTDINKYLSFEPTDLEVNTDKNIPHINYKKPCM